MPPPSSENDLKRLARRRLIGAVALTLLAVIVLPLLLEDEPPPTSSLAVHMATVPEQPAQPAHIDAPAAMPDSVSPTPLPVQASEPVKPEPAKPEPAKPELKSEPAHAAAKPAAPTHEVAKPVSTEAKVESAKPAKPAAEATQTKHVAASETFVVQLAALSDEAKANELKARAALVGLPAYTDSVGKLTRVRVGPFSTREAAVAAAVKLAENGMSGQVLTK